MKELVSVIIPVYKVEKYLEKCVDSVLSQTYKNLEIFLVDDGSPDNCGKICDEYAKKDKRVKVIHKQNGGLSSARNAALNYGVGGEFITFIDSDDWVEPTYVEKLYNAIKKYDCDISVCFHNECKEDGSVYPVVKQNFEEFYSAENVIDMFFGKACFIDTAWAKMYKREIFNKVRYPQGMHYEDAYVISEICAEVKKGIAVVPFILYNYMKLRSGAITTEISEKIFDWVLARRHALEIVGEENRFYVQCCLRLFYTYGYIYKRIEKNKKLLKVLNRMYKEDFKKYKKYLPFKARIKFFIFKNFRFIYKTIWLK